MANHAGTVKPDAALGKHLIEHAMAKFLPGFWHRPRRTTAALACDDNAASAADLPPHAFDQSNAASADNACTPAAVPKTATAVALELRDVGVAYGDLVAVNAVSGSFAAGSLTAVVGPNGAGKSSLLKAIGGVLPLRFGAIRPALGGKDIAYLPQQAEIDRSFPVSVGELIALGAWRSFGAFRRPPDAVFERVAEAAASAGLEGLLDRPVENLSVGEFQRALFARLLLQDAPLILLDEPFAALDERTSEDLLRLVVYWHQSGRTVIAVLHDFDQVRQHFPTAILLARSCIAWGDTAGVLSAENLNRARKTMQALAKNPVAA
jgi:zinc/manganese transport system ATP-binding protein